METCPYCGAAKVEERTIHAGLHEHTACWNDFVNGKLHDRRDSDCYERQIAQQAELLKQAVGIVRAVAEAKCCGMGPVPCSVVRYQQREAAALLPKLEEQYGWRNDGIL